MRFLLATLVALALAAPAGAEVYKWVDKDGTVHYTDKPPEKDAKPAKLPPVQTYTGKVPVLPASEPAAAANPAAAPAGQVTLRILSPGPEETIREAQREVPVRVAVDGGGEGLRFVYYLDGSAQALPSDSTTFVLKDVERGSHTIGVSALDETGREVAAAAPVTIHMKPPIARKPPKKN